MLSLDSTQLAIVASADKTISWLFDVTDSAGPTSYYWSTKTRSYGGNSYTTKIIGESFSGVELCRSKSELGIQAPNELMFSVSNAGNTLTAANFEGGSVALKLAVSDGSNEEIICTWKFTIKQCYPVFQTLKFQCEDFIQDYLEGDYPNGPLIKDISLSDDPDPNDTLCVPVPFGTCYIPLRSIYITDQRYYVLGTADSVTYSISKVRTPTERGAPTEWDSGSYSFTQSTKAINGVNWRVFQPIIMDTDADETPDACGLWRDGPFLDMPTRFSRSDTSAVTNPADVIEWVLKDFGVSASDIDTGVGSSFAAAESTYTSWGLTFNGAFFHKQPRRQVLAQLLIMCHSCLRITDKIELHVLSKTSQKTVTKADVIRRDQEGRGLFDYTPITQEQSDSGHVAFTESGNPQSEVIKVKVPAKSTTDCLSGEILQVPLVHNDQAVQTIGSLYYQRKLLKKANVPFTGKGTLLALQPDDVITMNDTDYGGNYPVLIDSMRINYAPSPNPKFDIDFVCIRFSDSLDDWSDLSPGALSIATDDTEHIWEPLQGGPGAEGFSLDQIADGFEYARVLAAALSDGAVLLSEAMGNLDNIANGTTYGKVLLEDLSGGHIILGTCTGDLDDVSDGSTYGRVLLTDISAGHILLAECTGDLDDVSDGATYAKVLATDISAGHIKLAECTGDLDDISNGAMYGRVLLTDISAGHILLVECVGDLDDVADGTVYGKVKGTDISAGHILLSECTGDLDDISDGATYAKVLATDISAGHILLSECAGDLDDIANGAYGKVLTTAISAGKIQLTSGAGVTGTLSVSYTEADATGDNPQDLDWIDGTSGTLTLSSSGKLAINAADALEIQAAGNIKVLAGADINLIGNDSDPGLLKFTTSSMYFTIGSPNSSNYLNIYPSANDTGNFVLGSTTSRFNDIHLVCSNEFNLKAYDSTYSYRTAWIAGTCDFSNKGAMDIIVGSGSRYAEVWVENDNIGPRIVISSWYDASTYTELDIYACGDAGQGNEAIFTMTAQDGTPYGLLYAYSCNGISGKAMCKAYFDANNYSYVRGYATAACGYTEMLFCYDGTARRVYGIVNEFRPNVDMIVDLGQPDKAWDDCYADDFHNEADYYFLDDRDDLAAICNIAGSGEYDPVTGFEIIDDSTLPPWMLARRSKDGKRIEPETGEVIGTYKAGDIEYSSRGKPLLSQKINLSLTWGALRQINTRLTALEAALAAKQ